MFNAPTAYLCICNVGGLAIGDAQYTMRDATGFARKLIDETDSTHRESYHWLVDIYIYIHVNGFQSILYMTLVVVLCGV